MVLTATVRPITGSTALYTTPIAPRPSSLTTSYLPAFVTVGIVISICRQSKTALIRSGHASADTRVPYPPRYALNFRLVNATAVLVFRTRYGSACFYSSFGVCLRLPHGFAGRHRSFRHRHVGFAHGPVHLAGSRWRLQPVRQQIALQRNAVGPNALKRRDVFDLQYVKFPLRVEHPRIRSQHLPVLVHHQSIRFLCARQHLFAIFRRHQPRICVLVDRGRGARAQRQRNSLLLLSRPLDVGSGCRHIPLISIEERNLDGHFCNSLPSFRVRYASERFVVVFHSRPQLHIRNGSAPGLQEHTLGPPLCRLGDSNRRTLLRNCLHHLFLVQFRPVLFQVSRHRRHWHFRLPDHCRKRPPFLPQSVLLHSRAHSHALCFHFRLQHFAFVRLSRVHQPPLGFCCILRNLRSEE